MTSKLLLSAVVVAGSFAVAGAEGAVVYREVFGRDAGTGNTTLDFADWNIRLGQSTTEAPADATSFFNGGGLTEDTSFPADLDAVNSNPATATIATGLVNNFNGGGFWNRTTLYWTDEYTVDSSVATVDSFQFHYNVQSGYGFRVAVEVGGDWYVATNEVTGFSVYDTVLATVDFQPMDFTTLVVDESPTSTVSGLPAGDVTAFGVWADRSSGGFDQFDTFTINATVIPEPASIAAVGLLGALGLRRRR
ncbi:MAG: PEP-CTERM sorting domain-containing protein [Planctomycetota bacterium]